MLVTGPRAKRNAYRIACPTCQVPAGHYCVTADGKVSKYAHVQRDRIQESAMPDLREWWRSMARYEGNHPLPRAADLVVP